MDREAARLRRHELLHALRDEPLVPQALFELLSNLIETIENPSSPDETPTKPDRKVTPAPMKAIRPLDERIGEIFDDAKRK